MKKWIPVILSALLLTGCGASAQDNLGYRQITMEEAAKRMEQEPAAIILDVRRPDEYRPGTFPGQSTSPTKPSAGKSCRSCRTRTRRFWCIAAAATAASRPVKSWRRWAIPRCWNLAVFWIGPARWSQKKHNPGAYQRHPVSRADALENGVLFF